jgi:hypothetical protein
MRFISSTNFNTNIYCKGMRASGTIGTITILTLLPCVKSLLLTSILKKLCCSDQEALDDPFSVCQRDVPGILEGEFFIYKFVIFTIVDKLLLVPAKDQINGLFKTAISQDLGN